MKTEKKTCDFLTLVRNAMLIRFALDGGFRIRNFISQSGEFIFSVLFQNMDNIKRHAEEIRIQKEVAFGNSIIFLISKQFL